MNPLRSQSPLILVLLVVGLLALLSVLGPGQFGGVELRPVQLLADVRRPEPATTAATLALPPPNGPTVPVAIRQTPVAAGTVAATGAAEPVPATVAAAKPRPGPAVANLPGLEGFVAALRQTKATGSKTRIAYFGDSMIEADLLTGDLRNSLQTAFGGSGVGFVPMKMLTAEFRETIHQTFSDDWYEYNLLSDQHPKTCPLGVSGHAFLPRIVADSGRTDVVSDTSWVAFRAGQRFAPNRRLTGARLFYGPGRRADQVRLTANGRRTTHALNGREPLNELLLKPGLTQQLRLDFATHGPRPVYGVSFESPQGITLDNFSFRGTSGPALLRIPAAQLAAFGQALDYRLVILHYGVNIADTRNKNYDFYAAEMRPVVQRMRQAFPNASILIVSMSDKGIRRNGEFVTDPTVPLLVAAQQRLAQRTRAAFWNLFEAMGGENSMTGWVEQVPPLARKDYMHINSLGGRQMAKLLFDYLMAEYRRPDGAVAVVPKAPDSVGGR